MKKILALAMASIIFVSVTGTLYAGDSIRKLGRGVANTFTFPFEIIEQMKRVNNTDGPFASMTYGVVKGVAMAGVRAVVGVYEVATFPVPFPQNYKPILTDPEFFFEDTNY